MSQPGSIPPPPIPPVPVAQLAYSTPQSGRPGLVTAIGVMSIIIASIGLLANFSQIGQAVMFAFVMPKITSSMTTTTTTSRSFSTSAVGGSAAATTSTTAPPGSSPLTQQQIQSIVAQVQSASNNGLDAGQVTALTAELQTSSTPLVDPQFAWSPVQSVDKGPDGTVTVAFNGGMTTVIAPNGASIQSTAGLPGFPFKINAAAGVAVGIDGIVSLALCVLLLIAGIRVFKRSPGAFRQHRFYAWVKIPVAVFGGVALGWFYSEMFKSIPTFPGAFGMKGFGSMIFVIYALWYSLLGSAYPIGLLFALRSKTVRAYYNSIGSGK